MAGPWEKYQPTEAPAAGPWTKYAADGEYRSPHSGLTRAERQAKLRALETQALPYNPTDGMSGGDRLMAGVGKSFVDTGAGLKQVGTSMAEYFVRSNPALFDDSTAGELRASLERQYADQAKREQRDSPLMSDGAGIGGNVVGTLAQLVAGPAVLARGTAALPAVLPRTLAGNAVQGATFGAAQPTTSDGGRVANAALGTALGSAGVAVPRAVAGSVRGVRSMLSPMTRADEVAVRTIQGEASNPAALMTPNPSQVTGGNRTLFEESLDPGVARLETKSRGLPDGRQSWAELDSRNNLARVEAVRGFAGDEAAVEAARAARDRTSGPLYAAAKRVEGVDTSRLVSQVDRLADGSKGRPAVQTGLRTVRDLLDGTTSVRELSNVRDTIGDMLSGKYGGDTGAALSGSRALIAVRDQLDNVLEKYAPQYGQARRAHIAGSKPINRMETGQALIGRASGNVDDPLTGAPVLTAHKFGGQVKNLDATARGATGFRKAKAANVLEPEDFTTIGAVQDDLARAAQRLKYGSGGGSHTDAQGMLGRRMAAGVMSKMPFGVGAVVESLQAAGEKRVAQALGQVLQDPQAYRQIAARLSVQERKLLERAMIRIGGTGGALTPALSE